MLRSISRKMSAGPSMPVPWRAVSVLLAIALVSAIVSNGPLAALRGKARATESASRRIMALEESVQEAEGELHRVQKQLEREKVRATAFEASAGRADRLAADLARVKGAAEGCAEREGEAQHKLKVVEDQAAEGKKRVEEAETQRDYALNDLQTGVYADRRQLAELLRAEPAILERRGQEISSMPQRGVLVTAAGRKRLANAFVGLHVLRHHLKSTLPVAITYWGPGDSYFGNGEVISDATKKFFEGQLPNVTFRDLSKLPYPTHQRYVRRIDRLFDFEGWKFKVFAIYSAPFQEVLSLDSDSMPLIDPSSLFDIPEYRQYGNLFFSDRWSDPPREHKALYEHFGLFNPWAGDNKQAWPAQTDSGQLLFNRHMHADVLEWLLFLNVHDEFTYRYCFGDKDTYRAAFDLAGKRDQFFQSPHRLTQALYQPKPDENFAWRGYIHLAPNGSAVFLHRSWFSKYDANSDDRRPINFITVGLSQARGWTNQDLKDWTPEQVEAIAPSRCSLDPLDVSGSQERCGFKETDEGFRFPAFPIPTSSALAHTLEASDQAFAALRAALAAHQDVLS